MRRLLLVMVPVLVIGVIATEMAMDLDRSTRSATYQVYAVAALMALALYPVVQFSTRRFRSIAAVIGFVGLATVSIAAVAVVMAANSMFFSAHDRDVLLVVLGVGVALAAALATTVGHSVAVDLRRVQEIAGRVGDGELSIRTEVTRPDELGDLARSVDSMIARLDDSERERTILLASIGHDLRTPLASLRAAIEAVQDGVADDPDRYLAGMSRDVVYLSRLIDDLFEYSQIESGSFRPVAETVDLRELVDEAVEVATPLAVGRDIDLVVRADDHARVAVDPAAMGRVLRNLIDNAIRHSPDGGTVTIEVTQRGFVVMDEGPGFPLSFRPKAFERFTRADDARSGTGAGLGLAIARGLVEAHNGTIGIGDGPGGQVVVAL